MTETFPLVCTRGVVVFPDQDIVIDVGREPSLQAVDNAQNNFENHIVLVSQKDITTDEPGLDDIYHVGTLCEVRHVRRFENFIRVKFRGLKRVRLNEWIQGDTSDMAVVEELVTYRQDETEEQALMRMIVDAYDHFTGADKFMSKDMMIELSKGVGPEGLSDKAVTALPISLDRKQAYLETLGANDRLEMLLADIEKEKKMGEVEKKINDTVKQRIDQGQKDYYLREKLNAIKEELGDVVEQDKDAEQIRKRLEENPYPENIKKKVKEELSRYEILPMASGETGVIKTYVDWLMDLPWWQETQDNQDLNQAQATLDADHYGLEKVKERILEYLAVKQMTNSLKAPILCLVGPPGVGKTSLARSVARALDRKFVKISLGGVRDEAEIRGHRRTYLGAMPGRIIQGMKKAGVVNPVFLIDEIDKMASDYKGDPSSAMLEVLDPEQNSFFSDHYIEEPYDLSKVLFIATANYLENIPPALRDRLEIIQLSSYTDVEKIHIAKEHLLPKQLKENGLQSSQLKISDDLLLYLIRYYTREAGVRQLERTIATICRKTVLAILKDNKKSIRLSKKLIHEWLGNEKVDYGHKEKKDQIGTVTGLAYTSFGGDILQIEANRFEGKGRLILTGQLGDVMKESANIALDYIKAHAKEYKIDPKLFETNDVHIHVPEGAVPKDGPSAGVTMTTALVSCFAEIPVKANLAMTGEVTLRGNVLPIGGLKEKSLAAYRSGITTILIPKENVRDLDEIPQEVKDAVDFIPVSSVKQVLKHALVA
ncbi:MAG: endopeptidase La [Absicoccus sp.]|uniref:Lon protease n=1 Tax=Absicoccus intestinalis TaxID=2926319 RepID=A0ABU4WQG5_9FIRM|nr:MULTISPECIES: endopeptidase La [unclassified Absicoccus]MDX8418301.1 endopeptidase La [Absicoccus sp. CLA-KB-P134]MDY3035100.1 endopeptidase La [Absicoccus sp.]